MSKICYLFVYGTLRTGQESHNILKSIDAKLIAQGLTSDNLLLIGNKNINFPYLIDVNFGKGIKGEIYKINEDNLILLDELEEHQNFFKRKKKSILYYDCGMCNKNQPKTLTCWTYVIDDKIVIQKIVGKIKESFDIIESGDWIEYKNSLQLIE
jgi:gamma-glutamylcyclotransferase (GGCT)/AIG2-like uncharacterized protein YtfP